MTKQKNIELNIQEKNKILDAALKCFIDKGYANSSLNDIIKIYGKSKGNIYYYFKNKEEIFIELLKKWREELFDQVYVAQHYEKNIFKFVNFFIDGFYEYVSKNLKFFRVKIEFLSIAIHNKKIQKIHIDSHKKWRGICFPYKNVFKKNENFELFVDYLFYLIDGIIIRAIIENKFIDNNQKENLKKIVLKNLKDLIK